MRRLGERLKEHQIPFVSTLEPGGTKIGKKVRQILLDPANRNLTSLAELLLYAADRAQHVDEIIRPALAKKKWVLCDRYFDATVAYQGSGRGQDMALIRVLNAAATGGISPDVTFLLDCPVEVGLGRAIRRNRDGKEKGQDRFEKEKITFHQRVRQAYLDLASGDPKRFVMIDATMAKKDVEEEIFRHLRPFLDRRARR